MAAVETGTLRMRDEVAAAASATVRSLKRSVVLPALDVAIAQAVVAPAAYAKSIGTRGITTTQTRAAALGALEVAIEHLRTVQASQDTQALGLGW